MAMFFPNAPLEMHYNCHRINYRAYQANRKALLKRYKGEDKRSSLNAGPQKNLPTPVTGMGRV